MQNDEGANEIDAYIHSKVIDSAAEYAQRGRPFKTLSDSALTDRWLDVTREWAGNVFADAVRVNQNDLTLEAILRSLPLPHGLVTAEHEAIVSQVFRLMTSMSESERQEFDRWMSGEFDKFKSAQFTAS